MRLATRSGHDSWVPVRMIMAQRVSADGLGNIYISGSTGGSLGGQTPATMTPLSQDSATPFPATSTVTAMLMAEIFLLGSGANLPTP